MRRHGLAILQPVRVPGMVLFISGIVLTIAGMAGTLGDDSEVISLGPLGMSSANAMAQWGGALGAMAGLLLTVIFRERYAVKIDTADGEKLAVVSSRKDQIVEIVSALNRALMIQDVEAGLAGRMKKLA